MFARKAKNEIVDVLRVEVSNAAAKQGRDQAEHGPQGAKAVRCVKTVGHITHVVHKPNVRRC
jgi:hypothetical protein